MSTLWTRAAVVSLASVRTAAQPTLARCSLVNWMTLASEEASVLVAAEAGEVPRTAPPMRAADTAARAPARRRRLVMPPESAPRHAPVGRNPVGTRPEPRRFLRPVFADRGRLPALQRRWTS